MVFTGISLLIHTQWKLLRSTFDAEGHEHRVQKRKDKKHAKQQRKEVRKAARQARRAQRSQRYALLSPTAVGEPTDDEERLETSTSSSGKRPRTSPVSGGSTGARTTETLTHIADAKESSGVLKRMPEEGRRDAPQPLQKASLKCVDKEPAVADATTSTVTEAVGAVPHQSMELALEMKAQLEQRQRKFYESLGGYSTVDEEDDELLLEVPVDDRQVYDVELPLDWKVVGIKKAAASTQISEKVVMTLDEATEYVTLASTDECSAASSASASMLRRKSLPSLSSLAEAGPKDEELSLRDSTAFGSERNFDVEKELQSPFATDHELRRPSALPSDNSSLASIQRSSESSTVVPKANLDPRIDISSCGMGLDVKEKVEDKDLIPEKHVEINMHREKLSEVLTTQKELEMNGALAIHDSPTGDMYQPVNAKETLFDEELVATESEEELESLNMEEVEKEIRGESVFVQMLDVVERQVMVEEVEELLYLEEEEDISGQQESVADPSLQSLAQSNSLTSGLYSPGTADEYGFLIYENLRAREHRYHVTENVFAKQQSVRPRMRAVLVDWLIEVHQRFELEAQTLYLAVNYIDRYLAQASVNSQRFQLVGVAALLIASKFEEIYPCDMEDLLYICERSYSRNDLVDCERDLLNVFKFNLAVPSVSSFLGYYLEHFEEEDKLIRQLANYFAELSLLDFVFGATYEPSIIACACMLAAYCYVENQVPSLVWNCRLKELTGYAVKAIIPCTKDLWSILAQPTDLTAVATKYSANELGEVAQLPLDDLDLLLR